MCARMAKTAFADPHFSDIVTRIRSRQRGGWPEIAEGNAPGLGMAHDRMDEGICRIGDGSGFTGWVKPETGGTSAFLQAIIDAEPACVKLLAGDGSLIMMNRAGLDMIEADTMDQVKGSKVSCLVGPEYRDAFDRLVQDVFRGITGKLDFEVLGLQGGKRWLATHAVPLRDGQGTIVALLGITQDITERKVAERALQEEKKFSDTIIDSLPGNFYMCDDKGNLLRWNKNEQESTGYSMEELSRMRLTDLFREDRPLIEAMMREVFSTGSSSVEARLTSRTGMLIPLLLSGFRMTRNDRTYLVGMGIDISDRKRLEAQLIQSQKMESIGTMVGGV